VKNSFFLVIPEQKKDLERSLTFQETSLTQWVSELPSANPGLATRLFHDLIIEMNRLEMEPQARLDALEILRHNFLNIEDYLRSRLTKYGFPKSSNDLKILDILISIEKQLSIGYWCIVKELTYRSVGWFQGKSVALAIERTIKGLSGIIVSHYTMNRPVPDWIWIDLHSLYKLSIKVKKETTKITDETCAYLKSISPEDCYKQILLFSLSNPSGLMQKEFHQIYQFTEKFCGLIKLDSQPIADQNKQCLILLDEDKPPHFISDPKTQDSSCQFLDLSRVYKASLQDSKFCSETDARFSSIDVQQSTSEKLPPSLFYYLTLRWQGEPLSGAALFRDRLDRLIAIGLDATHILQANTTSESDQSLEIKAETASEQALSCQFSTPGQLSIGSLVSFRKLDAPKNVRQLGVVCKINIPKQDNRLIFELNAIAAQSFAFNYHKLDADPAASEQQKGLIYALKDNEGEKSYIIIDSFSFKDGDMLRMYLKQENFPIIIRNRKNIGLGYWQFECRRLEEKIAAKQEPKKGYDFI
jgi:cyclic-di-GMP-binding protein